MKDCHCQEIKDVGRFQKNILKIQEIQTNLLEDKHKHNMRMTGTVLTS